MNGGRGDATPFLFLRERRGMERRQGFYQMTWKKWFLIEISGKVVLRCSKYFFDYSKVRSTANPKLALWAQTLGLRPFRFTKNGLILKGLSKHLIYSFYGFGFMYCGVRATFMNITGLLTTLK